MPALPRRESIGRLFGGVEDLPVQPLGPCSGSGWRAPAAAETAADVQAGPLYVAAAVAQALQRWQLVGCGRVVPRAAQPLVMDNRPSVTRHTLLAWQSPCGYLQCLERHLAPFQAVDPIPCSRRACPQTSRPRAACQRRLTDLTVCVVRAHLSGTGSPALAGTMWRVIKGPWRLGTRGLSSATKRPLHNAKPSVEPFRQTDPTVRPITEPKLCSATVLCASKWHAVRVRCSRRHVRTVCAFARREERRAGRRACVMDLHVR